MHSAGETAGGALFSAGKAMITISFCWFTANSAQDGGAVHVEGAAAVLVLTCSFTRNIGQTDGHTDQIYHDEGGAMYVEQTALLNISLCTFVGNSAFFGGALCVWRLGELLISLTSFIRNTAKNAGGAVKVEFFEPTDSVEISASTFTQNTQTDRGLNSKGGGSLLFLAEVKSETGFENPIGFRRKIPCPPGFDKYKSNDFEGSAEGDRCLEAKYKQSWTCPIGCTEVSPPAHCRRGSALCRPAKGMKVLVLSSIFTDGHANHQAGAIAAQGRIKVEIESCSFMRMQAGLSGGAVHSEGLLTLGIRSSVFAECVSKRDVSSLSWWF